MRITICYPHGRSPLYETCRVFGFGDTAQLIGKEWVVYETFDLPDAGRVATALVDALVNFGTEYRDESFSSSVPESASITAGLIEITLSRSDFWDIPYRSLTRQRDADFCTEIVRRAVPASAITEPSPSLSWLGAGTMPYRPS